MLAINRRKSVTVARTDVSPTIKTMFNPPANNVSWHLDRHTRFSRGIVLIIIVHDTSHLQGKETNGQANVVLQRNQVALVLEGEEPPNSSTEAISDQ